MKKAKSPRKSNLSSTLKSRRDGRQRQQHLAQNHMQSHPFLESSKDNFPNLDDAFKGGISIAEKKQALVAKLQRRHIHLPPQPSSNRHNEFRLPSTPQSESLHEGTPSPDVDRDHNRSVCSYASTLYGDVSVDMSIGTRACLAEHRHYVCNHGFDGERPTKTLNNRHAHPPSHSKNKNQEQDWDRIMEGDSFVFRANESIIEDNEYDNVCSVHSYTKPSNISTFASDKSDNYYCDTSSDFFNSSRCNQLYTPEKNKPKVDEASRLARLGDEGAITTRGADYESGYDNCSQIPESDFDQSELNESDLVGMFRAAVHIHGTDETIDNSKSISQLENDQSISKYNHSNKSNQHDMNASWNIGDNVLQVGDFSAIAASFVDNIDKYDGNASSFIAGGDSDFTPMFQHHGDNDSRDDDDVNLSKREGGALFFHDDSFYSTPPKINNRGDGSPSEFNYLGISPMGGLNANNSVLQCITNSDKNNHIHSDLHNNDSEEPFSPVLPLTPQDRFMEENDQDRSLQFQLMPVSFDDEESSFVSSISKHKSSSMEPSDRSNSKSYQLHSSVKDQSLSGANFGCSHSCSPPGKLSGRAVLYEHGVEFHATPIISTCKTAMQPISELKGSNGISSSRNGKAYSRHNDRHAYDRKLTEQVFTPVTQDVSLTPSQIDASSHGNETFSSVANEFSPLRKHLSFEPKSLLRSFETNRLQYHQDH